MEMNRKELLKVKHEEQLQSNNEFQNGNIFHTFEEDIG